MRISEVPRDNWTPNEDNLLLEWGVLRRILDMQPVRTTEAELAEDATLLGTADNIREALRDLVRVGLVLPQGEYLEPTRAARRYAEMLAVGV